MQQISRIVMTLALSLLPGCGAEDSRDYERSMSTRSDSLDAQDDDAPKKQGRRSRKSKDLLDDGAVSDREGQDALPRPDDATNDGFEGEDEEGDDYEGDEDEEEGSLPDAELPTLDPAAEGNPNIIVFRIAQGTGTGSWNTQETMIQAKVGQMIRFVNDDTRRHRLHTNGAPCPHGIDFNPGETYDCVVRRTYDSTVSGPLYDHNDGRAAQVWLRVVEE